MKRVKFSALLHDNSASKDERVSAMEAEGSKEEVPAFLQAVDLKEYHRQLRAYAASCRTSRQRAHVDSVFAQLRQAEDCATDVTTIKAAEVCECWRVNADVLLIKDRAGQLRYVDAASKRVDLPRAFVMEPRRYLQHQPERMLRLRQRDTNLHYDLLGIQ